MTTNIEEGVVIFSKLLEFLDLIAEALRRRYKIKLFRFDGTSSSKERAETIAAFRRSKGKPILITPGSGDADLNFEFAKKLNSALHA